MQHLYSKTWNISKCFHWTVCYMQCMQLHRTILFTYPPSWLLYFQEITWLDIERRSYNNYRPWKCWMMNSSSPGIEAWLRHTPCSMSYHSYSFERNSWLLVLRWSIDIVNIYEHRCTDSQIGIVYQQSHLSLFRFAGVKYDLTIQSALRTIWRLVQRELVSTTWMRIHSLQRHIACRRYI